MSGFSNDVLASPGQLVDRAIELSIAHPGDGVCVAGPHGLAAMVALIERDFERVECAHHATCAGADETCDVLMMVGPMTAQDLATTVRRTVPMLRDGGVLLTQLGRPGDGAAVRNALAALRYSVAGVLIDRGEGRLVAYTLKRPTPLRKAG
jgi:hypothetical protein